jgi:GTP-binding protein Era
MSDPFSMTDETLAMSPPGPPVPVGIAAVVGRTNVGKSTLMNRILGEKVSIVSPIVQTTRNQVRGILTEERGQLVLIDTPGVHRAETHLGKLMNKMARSAATGCDLTILMMDGSVSPKIEDDGWLRRIIHSEMPVVCVLNKRDSQEWHGDKYRALLQTIAAEKEVEAAPVWFETSAEHGEGVDALVAHLFSILPLGELLFPAEMLTDYPRKLSMADIIRERLVVKLKDELPHAVAVWVDDIEEKPKVWTVFATIYVERSSQKGIVIGKKGRLLKSAEYEAGAAMSEIYDTRVKVKLWVKVEKKWQENFWIRRRLGYM